MHSIRAVAITALLLSESSAAQSAPSAQAERAALDDIVGVWQSDTVNRVSALSTCAASPQGTAVICEQRIMKPSGMEHAVNMFLVDSTGHGYVYYGVNAPGSIIQPTILTITNHVWVYGGNARQRDGLYYRTLNDFSAHDSYEWRQESSPDGTHWTPIRRGSARRQF